MLHCQEQSVPQNVLNFTGTAVTVCGFCTPDLWFALIWKWYSLLYVQLKAAISNGAPVDTLRTVFSSKSHAHCLFASAELAGVVLEVYKEAGAQAWQSLLSCLHSTCCNCAAKYALAIPSLKFLWKELCGECRHAMRAGTGDYSLVVMGCEVVMIILVASVACKTPSHSDGIVYYLVAEPHSWCCAVLCCAVLCCAVLCCAVLCCAVLRCAVLSCAA